MGIALISSFSSFELFDSLCVVVLRLTFNLYSSLDSAKIKPFFAYQNVRNIKRNKPNDCKLIHLEKYNYSFFRKDIITGKLWYCE